MKKNFFLHHPSVPYVLFIGIQAAIFTSLYNGYLFHAPGWGQIICPFFAFANTLMCFYLLFLWWPAAVIVTPIFYLMAAIGSYYYNLYKIDINHSSIAFVFETHFFEAREFINWDNALWTILSLCIAFFWIIYSKLKPIKKPHYAFTILFLLLLIIINFGIFDAKWYRNIYPTLSSQMRYSKIFPINVIKGIRGYYGELYKIKSMGPIINCAATPSTQTFTDKDLTIIFIIGESARADHFQLNGYTRETNPRLVKEHNLINFPQTVSFAACTRYSVPVMITPSDSAHPKIKYSSFIDLFNKYNFETYWISLNDALGTNNNQTTRLLKNIDHTAFRESMHLEYELAQDEVLYPLLISALKATASSKFIVLHTRGSHYAYQKRYCKKSRKFVPDTNKDNTVKKNQITINAYDNSIVATDDFICSVIDNVRDDNAVVIYASDHGESLGEDGYYQHGNPKRIEQRMVPFMIWCSDTYIARHKDKFLNLRNNTKLQVSHDYIFPTTLSLAGISSKLMRGGLDLSTSSARPGSGTSGIIGLTANLTTREDEKIPKHTRDR